MKIIFDRFSVFVDRYTKENQHCFQIKQTFKFKAEHHDQFKERERAKRKNEFYVSIYRKLVTLPPGRRNGGQSRVDVIFTLLSVADCL